MVREEVSTIFDWVSNQLTLEGRADFETIPSRRNQAVAAGVLVVVVPVLALIGARIAKPDPSDAAEAQ